MLTDLARFGHFPVKNSFEFTHRFYRFSGKLELDDIMLTKNQITRLTKIFQNHQNINFVYLFGSQASGKTSPISDVDIAVHLDQKLDPKQRFQTHLQIISETCKALQRNDVDVADLNDNDVVLRYQAIKKGKLLFCRNKAAKNEFFVRTISEYLDTEPMRGFHRQKMKEQIKRGSSVGRSKRFAKAAREAEKLYRDFEVHRTKTAG